jgi:hypothetical protein
MSLSYLKIPPRICSPRFVNETFETILGPFGEALGIPNELRHCLLIQEKLLAPALEWSQIHVKSEIFTFILNGNCLLFKLYMENQLNW